MKTRLMALTALAMTIAGGAMAGEPRGVQRTEDTWPVPAFYVACLGTSVVGEEHVVVWMRYFSPPTSEVQHFAIFVKGQIEVLDPDGNTWIGHEDVSLVQNLRRGESGRYVARVVFKPVAGDGPMWVLQMNGKTTITANGELVVDRPIPSLEDGSRCLPSNTK